MPDLSIDIARLDTLHRDLNDVAKEFKNADDFSDAVAEATGHSDLAGHVRDFAHKWNDKRKSMTEAAENLVKSVGAITDGFTKVDAGLAKALSDGEQQAQNSHIPSRDASVQ